MTFFRDVARIAQKSLICEASVYPKPGLVTPLDNGAHADMDYMTFIDSALALFPCYAQCAVTGARTHALPPREVLPRLRKIGIRGEQDMYRVTNGVNTHKGAIFLLGLLCAAAGRIYASGESVKARDVAFTAALFAEGIVGRELDPLVSASTAGERAYMLYRTDGARGEAERGFPMTRSALEETKRLEKTGLLSFRECMAHTLIGIMADNADSNLVSRGGPEALNEVRIKAREALAAGGMKTEEGRNHIARMEKFMTEKRLSPGGSADILSCTIFLKKFLS